MIGFLVAALALSVLTGLAVGLPDYLPNYEEAKAGDTYPLAMISPPARNFLNRRFTGSAV